MPIIFPFTLSMLLSARFLFPLLERDRRSEGIMTYYLNFKTLVPPWHGSESTRSFRLWCLSPRLRTGEIKSRFMGKARSSSVPPPTTYLHDNCRLFKSASCYLDTSSNTVRRRKRIRLSHGVNGEVLVRAP